MKQFRPSVEQALDSNLRRIEESTAALAAADDWILTYPPTGIRPLARSSGNLALQPKLSSSAHRFNSMVQVMLLFEQMKKNDSSNCNCSLSFLQHAISAYHH
jgi:hypothetical protein